MVRGAATMVDGGAADKAVQAYNFRLGLTQDPSNSLPIPAPERYDSAEWQLLRRVMQGGNSSFRFSSFVGCSDVGGNKTDRHN